MTMPRCRPVLIVILLALGFTAPGWSTPLTTDQLATLKQHLVTSPDLAEPLANGNHVALAEAMNTTAIPDYWAWRTRLAKGDVYSKPSPTGSVWSWPIYEGLALAKQNTWFEIFQGEAGWTNYSLDNNRVGVDGLFGPPNVAQKNHVDAHGRRLVTRAERLYVTGTGTPAAPGTMGWEGTITPTDISNALALP